MARVHHGRDIGALIADRTARVFLALIPNRATRTTNKAARTVCVTRHIVQMQHHFSLEALALPVVETRCA